MTRSSVDPSSTFCRQCERPLVDLLAQFSLVTLRGIAMSQGDKTPRQWALAHGPLCPPCLRNFNHRPSEK